MELSAAKKVINRYIMGHGDFLMKVLTAKRYYDVKNDILFKEKKDEEKNPMRNADNRIGMGFYPLLVDQKTSYMFTAPPVFDVHDKDLNQLIVNSLGDGYKTKCMELATRASNAGIGWVHYWKDGNGDFQWAVVPSEQVIPVWDQKLNQKLLAALRVYQEMDEETGDTYDVYEYWTDRECETFRKRAADDVETGLMAYPMFTDFYNAGLSDADNHMPHDYGEVPFIPFRNNLLCKSELSKVKKLIDAYDLTYSGFMNDLEDIQEVILVLSNYGGEDLGEFLQNLKQYKAIKVENMGNGDSSGVSTLTIEIPVEAREKMLTITKKAIFTMGQGVDPDQQGLDKTSGEAMKFVYALLELKAGQAEAFFTLGFNQLVRAILKAAGKTAQNIVQTWTRTSIKNDSELADMCSRSQGIVSQKTILAHHPFVDDVEAEIKEIDEEKKKQAEEMDVYGGAVGFHDSGGGEGGEK